MCFLFNQYKYNVHRITTRKTKICFLGVGEFQKELDAGGEIYARRGDDFPGPVRDFTEFRLGVDQNFNGYGFTPTF